MNRILLFACLLGLIMSACKEQTQQSNPAQVRLEGPVLIEMITKGYSVKDSEGEIVQDTLQQMQSVTYDALGREESNIYYNIDGTPQWRDVYEYNDKDFKIGSKYYEGGVNKITYKYEIDSVGRRLKYVAYDAQSAAALYDGYSIYEDGGKVRKDGFKDNMGVVRWQYEYLFDEGQNELGYVYIDAQTGKRYTSFYKTLSKDSLGRWTKRGIYENDSLRGIEERIYSYQ
ncbi:MAG: hypothetical protein ABJM06_06385 [Gilvibacter sp.]